MSEINTGLINPNDINPKQIGLRPDVIGETSVQYIHRNPVVKRLVEALNVHKQAPITASELADLQRLDTGNVTLEMINESVNRRLEILGYLDGTSKIKSGPKPLSSQELKEERELRSYLDKKDYRPAANFLLRKARSAYEFTQKLSKLGRAEVLAKEIYPVTLLDSDKIVSFISNRSNYVMCLKEAAVLAKEI